MERVLVVPREIIFHENEKFNGFSTNKIDEIKMRILKDSYFIVRDKAEGNPNLKQIIPYAFIQHDEKLFFLKRFESQAEERLHNKYSLGMGGHINPEEGLDEYVIEKGLERELSEEVKINCNFNYEHIGFINDDSNSVGQVHFGLVYKIKIAGAKEDIEVNEKDMMRGEFKTIKEIDEHYSKMETWSQILFDYLKGGV